MNISKLLLAFSHALSEDVFSRDMRMNPAVTKMLKDDPKGFTDMAKYMTKRYAT